MRELKFKYLWQGQWYYIDLYEDNTRIAWELYENRNKTSPLLQSVGVKDKNGVEIYEGDIVEGTLYFAKDDFFETPEKLLQEVGEVIFNMDEGAWHLGVKGGNDYDGGFLFRYDSIEVVGNIYQNL